MKEDIEKILSLAVHAPSGDNSQPWRFEAKDNVINVFSLPEKDNPIFNYRSRGTLAAHGALIENIVIAASAYGYAAGVRLFPDVGNKVCTASVTLEKSGVKKDALRDVIAGRATNRKFYEEKPLTAEQRAELLDCAKVSGEAKIMFIEDPQQRKELGKAMSVNEIVMLENHELHDYFYNDVRWTEKDEREKKTGLYAKTMELKPPQLAVFKLLQNWSMAKILTKLGMAKFIAKENAKLYGSESAIGIIVTRNEDKDFIIAGRIMQRIWLTATLRDLSMHLVTGVLFLAQRINAGESFGLSEEHVKRVQVAFNTIRQTFKVGDDGVIALMFRIGYAGKPSGISSRLPPKIEFR